MSIILSKDELNHRNNVHEMTLTSFTTQIERAMCTTKYETQKVSITSNLERPLRDISVQIELSLLTIMNIYTKICT
jgi:hypothetical protein